jgi:hypothetical protein
LAVTGNATVSGQLITGSGPVTLTDATGKIQALTSTYIASLSFDAANLTGTAAAINGSNITALNGSNIASGTVAVARLGSGSPSSANFLRGDGTWTTSIAVTEFNIGNSSTAATVNFSNGPVQKVTKNGSATYTLSAPTAGTYILKFIHDGTATAYTVTFSPSVKFPNGSAPSWSSTASSIDILTLYFDGTSWFGIGSLAYA